MRRSSVVPAVGLGSTHSAGRPPSASAAAAIDGGGVFSLKNDLVCPLDVFPRRTATTIAAYERRNVINKLLFAIY